MRLLATRETYYTRTIRAGEIFEALDHHARLLKTLKHCVDAPVEAAPVKPMDTGNSDAIVPPRRRGRPPGSRNYDRRDMQADGAVTFETTPLVPRDLVWPVPGADEPPASVEGE